LEPLAGNSKSVPHFRCYASPPPTEMCAHANRYEDRAAELLQEQVRESQSEWVVEKRWHAQKHYDSTLAKYMGGASKASSRDKEGQARSIWTFLLCGQGSNRTCEEEFTPLSRHASAAVLQLLSGYDWGGERFGFMIYNETNDLAWRWKLQNRKYDLFWDAPDSSLRRLNGSANAVQVSANEALPLVSGTVPYDPFDSSQFGPLSLVIGLLVVLVSLGLIYKLLLLAAQRIFLMDYSADDILYGKSESRVPLWLFVNAAGQKLQEPLSSSKVEVIDLLQIPVPSALPYDAWQATDCLIIVDHLASRLHEGVWRVAVLPMLNPSA
jgi:hypothetical protein